jgi:DNA mismatch endonuclease (patch repair protein)
MSLSRSDNMRRIRSKDTAPELTVRRLLRTLGFSGYRIHRADLPGKPDIAFNKQKKAIQVNGCFWHGHTCREGSRKPKSSLSYWLPKIARNQARDETNAAKLASLGWSVLTVWECELQSPDLAERLAAFMATCPDNWVSARSGKPA